MASKSNKLTNSHSNKSMRVSQTNATNAMQGQATDAQLTLSISQDATQEGRRLKRGETMEEINKWLLDPSTNHPSHRGEIGLWGRWYEAQKSGKNMYEQHPNRWGRRPLKYPTPKTSRRGSNGHFLGTPCPRGSGPRVHGVSREVTHHPVCTGVGTPCPRGPVSTVHPVPTRYPETAQCRKLKYA